jgi:hypothetical protein
VEVAIKGEKLMSSMNNSEKEAYTEFIIHDGFPQQREVSG